MSKTRTIKLSGFKFTYTNFWEFIRLYAGIFLYVGYRNKLKFKKKNLRILDCGSHIGMSILGFKKEFPESKIVGFEPSPNTFKLLTVNMKQNNIKGVRLVQAMVGDKSGTSDFYIHKADSANWANTEVKPSSSLIGKSKKIKVRVVRLSSYIKGRVDLVKLNIEGSETKVLREISGKLKMVNRILIQYHGDEANFDNSLEEVFKILDENSFTYTIKQIKFSKLGKDLKKSQIDRKKPYFLYINAKNTQK